MNAPFKQCPTLRNVTKLIDTARVSKSGSMRISVPARVSSLIEVGPGDIIGFYADEDGEIIIRRLK